MPHSKAKTKSKSKSKCSKGNIYRNGYTKKNGTRVPGRCITATSQSGKKTTTEFKKYQIKQARSHELARKAYHKASAKRCDKGQIKREGSIKKGYTRYRSAYTKKDGTKVKATYIAPTIARPVCIKDVGRKGKGKQLFMLEKNDLKQHGYENIRGKTKIQRHLALNKALKAGIKPLPLSRKLNALYVVNMNKDEKLAMMFKEDSEWVKTTKAYQNRPTANKMKSKSKSKTKSKSNIVSKRK